MPYNQSMCTEIQASFFSNKKLLNVLCLNSTLCFKNVNNYKKIFTSAFAFFAVKMHESYLFIDGNS